MKQQRKRIGKFDILQYLIMAALLAFMIIMLTRGNSKVVPMADIEAKMEAIPTVSELTKKDMNDAANVFGFDAAIVNEGIYYRVDDIMNVNELLIVRVEDDDSKEALIDAIDRYLESKTESFDGYGTNQFGLLSNAVRSEKGQYVFFGVGEDVLEWETEFLKCLR